MYEEIELTNKHLSNDDKLKVIAWAESYLRFKDRFFNNQKTFRELGDNLPKFSFIVYYKERPPTEKELLKYYKKFKREAYPTLLNRVIQSCK